MGSVMTDAWAADVASIHSEAAGVMHLHVVRDRDLPAVMLGVLAGNRLALQLHPAELCWNLGDAVIRRRSVLAC